MAEVSELEELGRMIMAANVKAEFLGLRRVVDELDMAFSSVVAEAVLEKDRRVAAARLELALEAEEIESVR